MTQNDAKVGGPDPLSGRCADVQAMLFDFVSHELNETRAELVRRHLAHCPACRAQAAELRRTILALRQLSPPDERLTQHVTEERRAQLVWAITHPVRDWIRRHHNLVAIVAALLVLALLMVQLRRADLRERAKPPEEEIEVSIQGMPE